MSMKAKKIAIKKAKAQPIGVGATYKTMAQQLQPTNLPFGTAKAMKGMMPLKKTAAPKKAKKTPF